MASHFEKVLVQHLTVPVSLKEIVERDLPDDILPTPDLCNVIRFAVDYWHTEGSDQIAPPMEVLLTHFANLMAEHSIDLSIEPEGTLEWALAVAQGNYIDRAWQPWVREFAMKIAAPEADVLEKPHILGEAIEQLMAIQSRFVRRSEQVDVRTVAEQMYADYLVRAARADDSSIEGSILGLGMIDEFIGGCRPGELHIAAGPPKSGKSFLLAHAAYETWRRGGSPVLYTLENSVDMTLARIACMKLGIDSRRWETGRCTPEEIQRVMMWIEHVKAAPNPFHIVQPDPQHRTVEHLVRRARTLGDSIFIDQLTFVAASVGSERRQRHEQIGIMLHELKELISTGRRLSCVMAHQINREGVKAAEKTGHLEMYHLAESAEIERTADLVLGLWQSAALRDVGRAWVQTLAFRRQELRHWEIIWRPFIGQIQPRNEIVLPDAA